MHNPKLPNIRTVLLPTVCMADIVRATPGCHRHGPAGRLNSGNTAHLLPPQA